MVDPVFWLSLSALMLTVSLAVFLAILLPTVQELNRTARSAERLFDTLNRELPATLDALRSTSRELTDLTEDFGDGVKSAKQIVQQVDRNLESTEKQLYQARITSQSAIAGIKVAWKTFFAPKHDRSEHSRKSDSESLPKDSIKQTITNELSKIEHELSERS